MQSHHARTATKAMNTASPNLSPVPFPPSSKQSPKYFHIWYDRLIDILLVEPTASLAKLSEATGKHKNWIGSILRSDAFRARYDQRRGEFHVNLNDEVAVKLHQVAGKSLDLLLDKIERQGHAASLEAVAETTDRVLQRLGMGTRSAGTTVNVQQNVAPASGVQPITQQELEEARTRVRELQSRQLSVPKQLEAAVVPSVEPVE